MIQFNLIKTFPLILATLFVSNCTPTIFASGQLIAFNNEPIQNMFHVTFGKEQPSSSEPRDGTSTGKQIPIPINSDSTPKLIVENVQNPVPFNNPTVFNFPSINSFITSSATIPSFRQHGNSFIPNQDQFYGSIHTTDKAHTFISSGNDQGQGTSIEHFSEILGSNKNNKRNVPNELGRITPEEFFRSLTNNQQVKTDNSFIFNPELFLTSDTSSPGQHEISGNKSDSDSLKSELDLFERFRSNNVFSGIPQFDRDPRQSSDEPFDPDFPGPPGSTTPDATIRYQPPEGGICITSVGERGQCLKVQDCPPLRPLVKQLHNKELLSTLLNNACRYEGGTVFFCCEFPAFQGGLSPAADTREPAFIPAPVGASLPKAGDCGKRNDGLGKIIGGEQAEPNEFPFMVGVGRPSDGETFLVDCGGTIITRRHVLTAALCFLFPEFFQATHVRVSDHNADEYDDVANEDYVIIGRNDPGFLAPTTQNNLMILTVDRDFVYSATVGPVCLPSFNNNVPKVGSKVIAAGWGIRQLPGFFFNDDESDEEPEKNTLKYIEQRVTSITNCQESYSDPRGNFRVVDHRNVCIKRAGEEGVCLGDGGGPIIQQNSEGEYTLVGVISTTSGCTGSPQPTLATRVSTYMKWIEYVVRGP